MRRAGPFALLLTGCTGSERAATAYELEMTRAVDLDPRPDVVEVALAAEPARTEFVNGKATRVWAYRDLASGRAATVPGPLIEAEVGNRLIVHFDNRLDDGTTIHFHGPRVPNEMDGAPMGESLVLPGDSFVYDFELLDAGTFWYHPHWHTDLQIERGLYGQLVVHGERMANTRERFFILDDVDLHADGTLVEQPSDLDRLLGRHGELMLVNGRPEPVLPVTSGTRERWHFTNASNGRYFELELFGHAFTVIGTDGGLLEEAYETATLRIAPGKRYDTLVALTGTTGSELALVTRPVDRGVDTADRVTRTVLMLRFEGPSQPPALDPALPVGRVERIPIDEATRVERFELGVDLKPFVGKDPRYSINDQYFPFADMHPGTVGDVAIWELVNRTPSPEPFHLHGTFMQALALDGTPIDQLAAEDVVDVPAGSTLRVAVRYERHGKWMFHSNIPEHAEAGMMRMLHLE